MTSRTVVVLGAGAWGTALALQCARQGHVTRLWCRDEALAAAISASHRNQRYLPDFDLPADLRVTASLAEAAEGADVAIGAVPSAATALVASQAAAHLDSHVTWLSAAKGIERVTLRRMTEVASACLPEASVAALSGPSFAAEVAAGLPTAVAVASDDPAVARAMQELVSGPTFRAYAGTDVIGVELGGAFKNVIAIAAGMVAGLGLGHDALAALVTRGLHEITRLAVSFGAERTTLAGLSGLGDLVLTCTGAASRNWQVGRAVATGQPLREAETSLGHVAEGVGTTARMIELAAERSVDVPIARTVHEVLFGGTAPAAAVQSLMMRSLKDETE